jgi:hypothetical protein
MDQIFEHLNHFEVGLFIFFTKYYEKVLAHAIYLIKLYLILREDFSNYYIINLYLFFIINMNPHFFINFKFHSFIVNFIYSKYFKLFAMKEIKSFMLFNFLISYQMRVIFLESIKYSFIIF